MAKRRRSRKTGWAGQWRHNWRMRRFDRRARRHMWRPTFREARVAIWAGLLAGLLGFNALQAFAPPPGTPPVAALQAPLDVGPGRESERAREARRYREELERQEGSPGEPYGPARSSKRAANLPVRVIDGDTFDHGGERIRIADIDTPELRARCEREARLARAATNRLRALLAAGPFELKRLGRDQDRYGRKLRIVTRGGRSIGDTLVSEGLARTWTGRRQPWC